MDNRTIDLHVHSTESDGTFTPEEVVALAKESHLSAIALTDHDTVSGVEKAREAAKQLGIELIPGVELSTEYQVSEKETKEIHIVGLFIDTKNEELLKKTAEFRECRDRRNEIMVERLQQQGFAITMEALAAENPDSVITRANIARFLYNHGCIKSIKEAFDRYIGDGCPCYVGRFKISPSEAAELIIRAGGIAVLAHPLLYHLTPADLNRLICELKTAGLAAIEAIYSTYSTADEQLVKKLAREHDLLISGGSDFHGTNKPDIRLGVGRGHMYLPYCVLDSLKNHKAAKERTNYDD